MIFVTEKYYEEAFKTGVLKHVNFRTKKRTTYWILFIPVLVTVRVVKQSDF